MKRWLVFLCIIGILLSQGLLFASTQASADDNTVVYGDADSDGAVSMKDVLKMRKLVAGMDVTVDRVAGDVDGDGNLTMKDVLLIRKFIAKIITAFPADKSPTDPTSPTSSAPENPIDWQQDLSPTLPFYHGGYDQLNDTEKSAYNDAVAAIEANVDQETTARDGAIGLTVSFKKSLPDENSVARVFRALYADHPEFYFLCAHYSYMHNPDGTAFALLLHYCMNASERQLAGPMLIDVMDAWLSDINENLPDVEKETALHDRLCKVCSKVEGNDQSVDLYYSPYAALVLHKAVADGYARALQLLCLAAKIPATVVEGFSATYEAHMWNVVFLDNEPYYVDPDWDDSKNGLTHAYFNVTTKDLTASHTMNFWFPLPPTCTATKYNYYHYYGRYVTTKDGVDFAKILVEGRRNGEPTVEVRFAPNVMAANRTLVETGDIYKIYARYATADVPPITGYHRAFFDSANVIAITFF